MKYEIVSERVGVPGELIDLDPETVNIEALVEGGHIKKQTTKPKKETD